MKSSFKLASKESNDTCGVLTIIGELTLSNTPDIRQLLINQIDKYKSIEVNLISMSSIDLSGVQLLYALKQSKPDDFVLKCQINQDYLPIFRHNGFDKILNIK
jgi:anti-anti-sigma regulatory factor